MTDWDIESVRYRFPALRRPGPDEEPVAWLDNAAGTQVVDTCLRAINDYLLGSNANLGVPNAPSIETDELVHDVRMATADLLGANDADEVSFGPNMTTIAFAVSRAIGAVVESGGLDPARLRLVYEGVADRPPQPGGREALAELGVPPGAPVVGNVAALTGHKDHATLTPPWAHRSSRQPSFIAPARGQGGARPAAMPLRSQNFVGWVERVRPPGMAGVQIMQEQLSVKPNTRCTVPWIPADRKSVV